MNNDFFCYNAVHKYLKREKGIPNFPFSQIPIFGFFR